jgi:hypothetical protein
MSVSTKPTPLQKCRALWVEQGWPFWIGIIGLVALFVLLRWNNFNVPLIRDEGDYAYSGQLLIRGLAPYEHAFVQKPPLVIYSYALSNLLLPDLFWSPRLLAYLFVALATALLGYIARLEFGKGIALPAMWLMTPMVLLPEIEQFPASVEMFMLFPVLATVAIYCHVRRQEHQPQHWYWFAAAFFAVTALLYKYTALPVLAFTFAAWFIEIQQKAVNKGSILRCLAFGFAGAVTAAAIEVGYFFVHDGGAGLWESTVLFNRYYLASGPFGLTCLIIRFKIFWSYWWILFFIPWTGLLLRNRRIWFWLGMLLCAFLATGMSLYGQYYIILMPFWALLSTMGIRALASQLNKWLATSVWLGNLLATVVVILVIRPDVPSLLCTPARFTEEKMGGHPFLGAQVVAEQVSQLTSPDDFVFVAGSEPQILYYTRRFSPTRFTTLYPLMIPSPAAQHYQQEAIQDLQKHPPALIVFVKSSDSWALHSATPPDFLNFLGDFIKRNYQLVGGYLNDGGKSHWASTDDALAVSDILLYERNNHRKAQ